MESPRRATGLQVLGDIIDEHLRRPSDNAPPVNPFVSLRPLRL